MDVDFLCRSRPTTEKIQKSISRATLKKNATEDTIRFLAFISPSLSLSLCLSLACRGHPFCARMLDFGQFDFGQFDFGQLAKVEIGRSRNWPKSKLIGRIRTDGVCSVSSFSLSFFLLLCFYFSSLFSCSYSSLSSFCFCSVSVFVPKNLN